MISKEVRQMAYQIASVLMIISAGILAILVGDVCISRIQAGMQERITDYDEKEESKNVELS